MIQAYREHPVQFGSDKGLFGVLCLPSSAEPSKDLVVVMVNSGLVHRSGANRIHVLMARALAGGGVGSLRFDLSGIGDSERHSGGSSLAEAVHKDIADAVDFAADRLQSASFILLGLCSGAYDSLQFSLQDPRVVGVVPIDIPASLRNPRHLLKHYRNRLFKLSSWRNTLTKPAEALGALGMRLSRSREAAGVARFGVRPTLTREALAGALRAMNQKGVASLFLFTGGIEENYNYEDQFRDCFPEETANAHVSFRFFPGSTHTFQRHEDREALIRSVVEWIDRTPFKGLSSVEIEPTPTQASPRQLV